MTKRLTLLAVFLFIAASNYAQSGLKFGHINSTQLLSLMPETKSADSDSRFRIKRSEKNWPDQLHDNPLGLY